MTEFPFSFLIVVIMYICLILNFYIRYTIILCIEKIFFNPHSLMHEVHSHDHENGNGNNNIKISINEPFI